MCKRADTSHQATHDNAELLVLSGERNPYPGRLGLIEEGALADLILVDGETRPPTSTSSPFRGRASSSL